MQMMHKGTVVPDFSCHHQSDASGEHASSGGTRVTDLKGVAPVTFPATERLLSCPHLLPYAENT
ncbi:hypothetical protein [Candidatus Marimicrobium litorale]|uniref:Uncharacterized protein n=1 Tax=Candidatus Marimicrobium litorale TaxID=2518991 RepID=A0ABT3T440_9GAMM|nr:hypothetical protein [Candidatus Marimicrobium litorale]MCX2977052.1 hypothetical protein [Candidatus Marimicrobium litorale]